MIRLYVGIMKELITPITDGEIKKLRIGDMVGISGYIYTGRDAVLPRLCKLIKSDEITNVRIDLQGCVIFHTAVSPAGVGPTSSNKLEIEASFPILSESGVKLHLGKGAIGSSTVQSLKEYNAVYAIIPPVTALLNSKIQEQVVVAFAEEGMEALHRLKVDKFPAIIAAANGESIY